MAQERALDLTACEPLCRREANALVVPLVDLLDLPPLTPSSAEPSGKARFAYTVEFAFETGGSYDRMRPETAPQSIEIQPVATQLSLSNATLAGLWRSSDSRGPQRGLTREAALERQQEQRDQRNLMLALLALAGVVGLMVFFHRTAYHRRFAPQLEWRPADEVVIDFSQPSASRVLMGTLTVVNRGEVPWFGRLLNNHEQPTRYVQLSFQPPDLEGTGLQLEEGVPPWGFLSIADGEIAGDGLLTTEVSEAVSDGKRLYLFAATEAFRDLGLPETIEGDFCCELRGLSEMRWRNNGHDGLCAAEMELRLRIQPEAAVEPLVRFERSANELYFSQGEDLEVGQLIFESRSTHRFAQPFVSEYDLKVHRDRMPVSDEALRLEARRLELPGSLTRRMPVRLCCDGELVKNPDPSEERYELHLLGPCHRGSEPGPHPVVLKRDPTRAQAVVRIGYLLETWEVYWSSRGPRLRLVGSGAERAADGGAALMSTPFPFRFSQNSPPPTLFTIEIGNSGRSGRGMVKARLSRRLVLTEEAAGWLHMARGTVDELLVLYEGSEPVRTGGEEEWWQVAEGEAPKHLAVKLDGDAIERIDGARLSPGQAKGVLELEVHVIDDQGKETAHRLGLVAPLEIEQLPGLNWLCIDFGTSAIAAAVGRADQDAFKMIDLQRVAIAKGKSFAGEDPDNPEAGTPFLPSWIVADGDLRYGKGASGADGWPAGFPSHVPRTLELRSPGFVGVPALRHHAEDRPERLVFSLKQWLGRFAPAVRFGEPVSYELGGRSYRQPQVPLDELLEASLAALAETYLSKEPHLRADQLVLCHPNTFTPRHKERFHQIAVRALKNRLGIAAAHHVQLVSESDAVAYAYCFERMVGVPRTGTERVLVYDFGAGTLDLSVIRIDWDSERFVPKRWVIEARLGVSVAGNYFDELLARIIDQELRKPEVLADTGMRYEYPLVAEKLPEGSEGMNHRKAVLETWRSIRHAKHLWTAQGGPFCVRVGSTKATRGVVKLDQGSTLLPMAIPPASDQVGLYLDESSEQGDVLLAIPAAQIHDDPKMREFVSFVTREVPQEVLHHAGLSADQIDTLLISGRGVLWPGLVGRLEQEFPSAHRPDFVAGGVDMKEVVARGAIALQNLRQGIAADGWVDRSRARIGILLGERRLVLEDEWRDGKPVDLSGFQQFKLVQVAAAKPDVPKDLKTLRKHFYVDLTSQPLRADVVCPGDSKLFVDVIESGSHLEISLRSSTGARTGIDAGSGAQVGSTAQPAWPAGSVLLHPVR
ncbi:MAG: Hsp70 family protein [Thermoanaerobaculia bacterium]|nr:Hsp70 family protein [Thermoanaerobaculia bacterium]